MEKRRRYESTNPSGDRSDAAAANSGPAQGRGMPVARVELSAAGEGPAGSEPAAARSRNREPVSTEGLIDELVAVAERLRRDTPSRVDVKILLRTLKELRYAFKVFAPYRSQRKVTVFGSARVPADDPCYRQAVRFGRAMAQAGWMVITGAARGIMEAGHEGAGRDASIGVKILLPFEEEANPIIAGDPKLVHLKYFFTRKLLFVKETDATAIFPGGFGTLDEAFEVLTLVQTGKRETIPIVYVDEPDGDYWLNWQQYVKRQLLERGYISESDLCLFKVTDDVNEAISEILGFYRVYHSMRYVGETLVLRLQRPLSAELLERINTQFADIVASGKFQQCEAFPEEREEGELVELPRLAFKFVRRDFGRLRQLIDTINSFR